MKTYSEILDDVETLLQDAGVDPSPPSANSVFATAELDSLMPSALSRISQFKPWQIKTTKSTVADTRDITLTTGDKWRLLGILKLEYLTAKDPPVYRNYTRFGDVISIKIDTRPPSVADIYFFWNKVHLLQKVLTTVDTGGTLEVATAVGDVTIDVEALGTLTIEEMTTVAITGDSTVYYVTSTATIAGNKATLSIWPPITQVNTLGAVVTLSLTGSTLDIPLEDYLARWLAAKACISKATKSYAQVNTAIATIALGVTAIAAVAARITQGIADIASGRVEAAKISAILDTANTEIDKIGARLTQATTDVADGRTEADKIPAIVTAAGTAIAAVAARITQALTDIASARTAIALGVTAISEADTEVKLANAQVDLAVTALASGSSLVNTIPVGGGAAEYMGQAASDVGTAQGFVLSGQGLLQKSSADFNNANVDLGTAAREVDAGMAKTREAQASLEQANTDMGANRTYIDQAVAQLRVAQGYFQESQGYVMEANTRLSTNASYLQSASGELRAGSNKVEEAIVNMRLVATRLQVSQGGLNYERWGRTELTRVESELRAYAGYPTSIRYPRD